MNAAIAKGFSKRNIRRYSLEYGPSSTTSARHGIIGKENYILNFKQLLLVQVSSQYWLQSQQRMKRRTYLILVKFYLSKLFEQKLLVMEFIGWIQNEGDDYKTTTAY